jgi:hypothetical protein
MTEMDKIQNMLDSVSAFWIFRVWDFDFEFVSDFVLRISNLDTIEPSFRSNVYSVHQLILTDLNDLNDWNDWNVLSDGPALKPKLKLVNSSFVYYTS